MLRYKLFRKDFEIWTNDIYLLPTPRVYVNNMLYTERNISIELHFLVFHARMLFMEVGAADD